MISTMGGGNEHAGHLSAAIASEAGLVASGAAVRAIAPPYFMENFLGQAEAIQGGVIALPNEADRILPVVATDDLAALAAELLIDGSWTGVARLPISSPDSLTPVGIAETVGRAIGHEVTFQQVPTDKYGEMLRGFGLPAAWADGLVEMARAQNAGFYDAEVEPARGLAPTSLCEWCERELRAVSAA
jgi:uncharacterized protein YbjT (DUF2867 family)